MDNMIWLYIAAGAAVLIIILALAFTAKQRQKQKFLARVLAQYGRPAKREYTDVELAKIKKYFQSVHDENTFAIDDITWNDLNLDEIFAQMNHTHSSCGEEELYRILREPVSDPETLEKRKELIRFFEENERLRTEFSVEYAGIGRTKKYSLAESVKSFKDVRLNDTIVYLIHPFLILVAIAFLIFKPALGIGVLFVVMIVNLVVYYRTKAQVEAYYGALSGIAYTVKTAEALLKFDRPEIHPYMEELKESLESLRVLKSDARWLGAANSTQVSANPLLLIVDYLRMMTHIDFMVFNHMVKIVRNKEDDILKMLHVMGYLEAMISIASYRETLPFFTEGEVTEKNVLELKDAYHPMVSSPVANSVRTDRSVLLTGSNASGKSTFLRTVSLCVLLMETAVTVPAHEIKAPLYRVYSSMALTDSVESGESYYIVEIKSIKRIMDALQNESLPVLAFVDEVLRGTNTVERIAASSEILKQMEAKNALVFAATHDVELTNILKDTYRNMHFEEQVEEDRVTFDYILKEGPATTRNAIKLLKMLGYDNEVVENSEKKAIAFMESSEWT